MKYTVGSLFAGVGGICLGFQQAKTKKSSFQLLWANEIDEFACETYRNNFNHSLLEGDIEKILDPSRIDKEIQEMKDNISSAEDNKKEILKSKLNILEQNRDSEFKKYTDYHKKILEKPIDILNGGFPCQAFSIAGEQQGFDDPRGNLFLSIVDLIEQLGKNHFKPRILFLENVKNLKSHDGGRTYHIIKNKLESCGYTIFEKVLNTMDFSNLPQNRERIYIIGFRDKEDSEKFKLFNDEEIKKHKIKKDSLDRQRDVQNIIDYSEDLNINNSGQYYYTRTKYPHYFMTEDEFAHSNKEIRVNLDEQINEMYQFYQCRRGQYVRKNKSDVCPTLTANMGTGGHNVPLVIVHDGIRKITPAEAFKLQGFPVGNGYELPKSYKGKPYSDSHLYKQAGNAVSVPMIKMLATDILKILEETDQAKANK